MSYGDYCEEDAQVESESETEDSDAGDYSMIRTGKSERLEGKAKEAKEEDEAEHMGFDLFGSTASAIDATMKRAQVILI